MQAKMRGFKGEIAKTETLVPRGIVVDDLCKIWGQVYFWTLTYLCWKLKISVSRKSTFKLLQWGKRVCLWQFLWCMHQITHSYVSNQKKTCPAIKKRGNFQLPKLAKVAKLLIQRAYSASFIPTFAYEPQQKFYLWLENLVFLV